MRKIILSTLLTASLLLLAACTGPGDDPKDVWFSPTIQPGQTWHQQQNDFGGVAGDLIYWELSDIKNVGTAGTAGITPQSVTLKVTHKSDVYFSSNKKFFSNSNAVKSLEALGISVEPSGWPECRGPCVIDKADEYGALDTAEVFVTNNNAYPIKLDVHSFVTKYSDKNEPNGSTSCSVKIHPTSTLGIDIKKNIVIDGALEFLSDVDCFEVPEKVSSVKLETTSKNATGVKAVIWEIGANHPLDSITLAPGVGTKTISVTNKKVRIFVSPVNRAGPANSSSYTLTIK